MVKNKVFIDYREDFFREKDIRFGQLRLHFNQRTPLVITFAYEDDDPLNDLGYALIALGEKIIDG